METIIENGKKMEGIPYPVAVWDAKSGMWDDSIEELSVLFANSEDEAIDFAKDYMLDSVYASDMDGEEQERKIKYYSNDGNYIIDSNRHEMHLYVFEIYADKYTGEKLSCTQIKTKLWKLLNMHGIACTRAKEGHTAGTSAAPSACMRLAFHIPT